jgi:ATP-binding cassette subfamily G (WHITE) protein 2 (SNQ2)
LLLERCAALPIAGGLWLLRFINLQRLVSVESDMLLMYPYFVLSRYLYLSVYPSVFEMFDDLILLKKGGNVVFFGELGEESNKLVSYFEERGATPIAKQENPAAWVLRAYAGEHSSSVDWGELYKSSDEAAKMEAQIVSCRESSDSSNKISFSSTYSTPIRERMRLMCARMMTIYRRS